MLQLPHPDVLRASGYTFFRSPLIPAPIPIDSNALDITKYIPVGCLRVRLGDFDLPGEAWASQTAWLTLRTSKRIYKGREKVELRNNLPEKLLSATILRQYRLLLRSGWIRMDFKAKDSETGQIRVYVLPDDVARDKVDRQQVSARRALQSLLSRLDISSTTWQGEWAEHTPVMHIDSSLDRQKEDQASLFYLFNTLPSPKPQPKLVKDIYARDAMYNILASDVPGLTTMMHPYQRRTAALMLQRETQPSRLLDPRLRKCIDQNGDVWYWDLSTSTCLREPRNYETPRGGICAETMGLGKTLICLALIIATKDMPSHIPAEYSCGTIPVRRKTGSLMSMAAATIGRSGTPWKGHFGEEAECGIVYQKCLEAIRENAGHYFLPPPPPRRQASRNIDSTPPRKIWLTAATIVVVPSNLVRQWELEIKKHTTGLKVLVVKWPRRKQPLPPTKELAEFDLILFSKLRFDQEAADGSDDLGRRKSATINVCRCPYIGSTRERKCTCFKDEDAYSSPLKDLHIKRLITDEGHTFGNASKSSKTEGMVVIELLQLSARWIVSGTPTQGLYGADVSTTGSELSSIAGIPTPVFEEKQALKTDSGSPSKDVTSDALVSPSDRRSHAFDVAERKDLEKLGNIATGYLKARPWANSFEEGDAAEWSKHVMQPRHGSKCNGNMGCLRSTLESMIVRHRPEDVEKDIVLPPLYESAVYLDGSIQDKLSLNTFSIMIVINAITSERKDADYFFHPRQRPALNLLVSNLRQASFHWSGITMLDIESTITVAKTFLEKGEVYVSPSDEALLQEAIGYGEAILKNSIKKAVSEHHEIPVYLQNECTNEIRSAWALDRAPTNPAFMGLSMIRALQKHVIAKLPNPEEGLIDAGNLAYLIANRAEDASEKRKQARSGRKGDQAAPTLAGGDAMASESSSAPRQRGLTSLTTPFKGFDSSLTKGVSDGRDKHSLGTSGAIKPRPNSTHNRDNRDRVLRTPPPTPKSILRNPEKVNLAGTIDPDSPLASASILSTASAKLSYLMDRIVIHQEAEKILVFYEAENVAYYIAQALECLSIKHLIYAKSLKPAQKALYAVAFNQSQDIRVLLMDISQAAFGLDMSSASRVYFINPVFSPQVEAQAVKRAHRIGQTKPVYVETLILKGSIEEVILDRRKDITNEEHIKCKSILDDQKLYEWIRNVRFIPVPITNISGPDQMALLETPQLLFTGGRGVHVPISDAELLALDTSPRAKGNGKVPVEFASHSKGQTTENRALKPLDPSKLNHEIEAKRYNSNLMGSRIASDISDERMVSLESSSAAGAKLTKLRKKRVCFQLLPDIIPDVTTNGSEMLENVISSDINKEIIVALDPSHTKQATSVKIPEQHVDFQLLPATISTILPSDSNGSGLDPSSSVSAVADAKGKSVITKTTVFLNQVGAADSYTFPRSTDASIFGAQGSGIELAEHQNYLANDVIVGREQPLGVHGQSQTQDENDDEIEFSATRGGYRGKRFSGYKKEN